MKRVLLSGADGYIGRHALGELLARGYQVHAISRNKQRSTGDVIWHATDLLDHKATRSLAAKVSATDLLHLAWVTEPGVYWQSPQNEQWLHASQNLLESFVSHGGRRALLAGTCAEYDWTGGHCIEDQTPLRAQSAYAKSKLAFREAAYALTKTEDLSIAWARVFFSFGPHERIERLVPAVIAALRAGDRAKCGDGRLRRDFMYVVDVARAMVAVLASTFHGDINLASGEPLTLEALVTRIAASLNAQGRVDFNQFPGRPNEPKSITADTSRLAKAVGWTPVYDLDSAIDKTITWWQNQAA